MRLVRRGAAALAVVGAVGLVVLLGRRSQHPLFLRYSGSYLWFLLLYVASVGAVVGVGLAFPRAVAAVASRLIGPRIVILTGSLVVGYAIGEVGVRVLPTRLIDPASAVEDQRRMCARPDPVVHHTNCPSFTGFNTNAFGEFAVRFTTNSQGLVDREIPPSKPAGAFRVLLLGDSMVEALQVEDHEKFASLLEARLGERAGGRPVEAINAGTSSYSPLVEYVYLKTRGLAFEPDVVLAFLASNDVRDDAFYASRARLGPDGLPTAIPNSPEPPGPWATMTAHARARLKFYDFLHGHSARLWQKLVAGPDDILDSQTPREQQAWAVTRRALGALRKLTADRGIPFVVFIIPVNSQVPGEPVGRFYPERFLVRHRRWQDNVQAICREERIECVDLLPRFAAAPIRPLYFANDGHLRPAGHQLVTDIVLETLDAGGVLARLSSDSVAEASRASGAPTARRNE